MYIPTREFVAVAKPYVFINDRMQSIHMLKHRLNLNAKAAEKFDVLNLHLRNVAVLPGQIVLVGDDSTQSCTGEEARLMHMAAEVRHALEATGSGDDDFMLNNYDFLQSLLGNAAIGVGTASNAWGNHLKGVGDTLDEISQLHRDSLRTGSSTSRQDFIVQRRLLFSRLGAQLKGFARYGTGLHNERTIKKMLGISTRSYLHNGEIKGYTQTVKQNSRATQLLKKGTPIGIALDTASAGLEIQEACSTGREEQCTKAKYVESSKLTGNIIGSTFGGMGGAALCGFTIVTGPGAIACIVLVGGAASIVLGEQGAKYGAMGGEILYEY